ncbi:MAG TPA: tripartite tricarboxylate transporter substrate binding protein [Microlunatus sp.]|nr:tripartite tricarboxylate transporter substrate binding protein [Microlunatus sp.]
MFDKLKLNLKVGAALAAAGALLVTAGCGATAKQAEPGAGTGAGEPLTGVRFMVPNTAGGGYDTTARAAAKVMDEIDATKNVEVFNLAGAGGTVGLSRTVSEKGNGQLMMMMGLGVVGAQYTNKSEAKLDQTTPIAKLIEESGAIVVPKNSPYQTIDDLVTAWKADPKAMAVGGGSSPGGPDHLLPMQLAQAVGIDPKEVNFVSYDGGGDLLPALLGGKIAFGASGFGEFLDQVEAGEVRVLAISGAERVDAIDAPTLTESGIDLVFTNWRGVVAPPEISDADKAALVGALTAMHASPEWKDVLAKNGWTDAYLPADEFAPFLTEQTTAVEDTLKKLGLA